ncbi:MAG TPA: phosphate ABC transporter permease PstA [Dehalococcoidia bacterium]|nr:phosphate ABC transporter permease PstA [Dehalococcoidia bacterium]
MSIASAPRARPSLVSRRIERRRLTNLVMLGLIVLALVVSLAPLIAVLAYVAVNGLPGLSVSLLTKLPRPVDVGAGGMANSLVGSLVIVGLAALLGTALGIAGGIYLAEYGHGKLALLVRFFADVLSGIPSIAIGLFVYVLLVVPMHSFSALAGAVALAIVMLPLVVRTTEEMLRQVPGTLREAGMALGVPRWRVVLSVVLPAAASGIITGTLLAVARIAGETAPLLFTAFGNEFWQRSLAKPIDAVPLRLFKYAIGPYDAWHKLAQAAALVLILSVLVLSIGARYYASRNRLQRE